MRRALFTVMLAGCVLLWAASARAATACGDGQADRPVAGGVSLHLHQAPLRSVLDLLATRSGHSVVIDDSIQGSVTLNLEGDCWLALLDAVLAAQGLGRQLQAGMLWIGHQEALLARGKSRQELRALEEAEATLEMASFALQHHSATAIQKMLAELQAGGGSFLSARGRLVADGRSNTLVVSDLPDRVARLRELVAHLDRPVDQVLIEGRIVVASEHFARDIGARFGLQAQGARQALGSGLQDTRAVLAGGEVATPAPAVNLPAGGAVAGLPAALAYTLLGRHVDLDMELSALEEEGRGEVVSRPRLVTVNQREGVIKQGREIGYMTLSGNGSGEGRSIPNVQFKEVVLELRVVPTITQDNRVFVEMVVKKDEVDRYIELAGYGSVPSINRREVTTAALVEDGQTVVVGGVYEFTERSSLSRVPHLADIPFLGAFFRKRGRSHDRAELLVFITPHILRVQPAPS